MTNTKVILYDIDGVLIRLPYYYSSVLEKQGYSIAVECLNSFYNSEIDILCLEGKSDVCKEIDPYLKEIGWQGSSKEYFRQQFEFESKYLDKNIFSWVNELRMRDIKSYLCTDQDKYRAEFLLKELNFESIFDGHFFSCFIGFRKCNEKFWEYVIKSLRGENPGIKPEEILFIDDIQSNIDCASLAGIRTILFKGEQFKLNNIVEILGDKQLK